VGAVGGAVVVSVVVEGVVADVVVEAADDLSQDLTHKKKQKKVTKIENEGKTTCFLSLPHFFLVVTQNNDNDNEKNKKKHQNVTAEKEFQGMKVVIGRRSEQRDVFLDRPGA